jgi:hypothetical protein
MISFLDGFTGAGIFGDLRIPGMPICSQQVNPLALNSA